FDISQDAVDYAADMYHCGGHAKFAVSDVRQLSALADQSVDVFVSFETLEHVPDPERIISEVKRVLKPGGTFIGSVPNLWCDETGN
ncbi:class I SAM-dependent methyltransferase, partial [Acinetobacter baumannii]